MTAPTPLQQQIIDVLGDREMTVHTIGDRIRDTTVSMQIVPLRALTVALIALEDAGVVTSRMKDPETAHRPRTRVYRKAPP